MTLPFKKKSLFLFWHSCMARIGGKVIDGFNLFVFATNSFQTVSIIRSADFSKDYKLKYNQKC
jgi:hypothetical protein